MYKHWVEKGSTILHVYKQLQIFKSCLFFVSPHVVFCMCIFLKNLFTKLSLLTWYRQNMDDDYIHTVGMLGMKVKWRNILHEFLIERKRQYMRISWKFYRGFWRIILVFQGGEANADQNFFPGLRVWGPDGYLSMPGDVRGIFFVIL